MEFKHTFHVFVDNFATTYKLLVYRLIVLAIGVGLSCAVIIPTLNTLLSTMQYEALSETFGNLWADIVALRFDDLGMRLKDVSDAFLSFEHLIEEESLLVGIAVTCLCFVYLIDRFLVGVGNYVTGALMHDKMVMHANSSFTFTLFKNLKSALLYSLVYAPLAFVYDGLCLLIMWAVVSVGLKGFSMTLIKLFLIAVIFLATSAIKLTFTTDWLPAMIHGKMNSTCALGYTLSRKGKRTGVVLSNALVLKLIIFGLNIAAAVFSLGAGLLITLPGTCLIQVAYNFVNYFDANRLKYFVDEYTVIGPKKETPLTREEFFKGETGEE